MLLIKLCTVGTISTKNFGYTCNFSLCTYKRKNSSFYSQMKNSIIVCILLISYFMWGVVVMTCEKKIRMKRCKDFCSNSQRWIFILNLELEQALFMAKICLLKYHIFQLLSEPNLCNEKLFFFCFKTSIIHLLFNFSRFKIFITQFYLSFTAFSFYLSSERNITGLAVTVLNFQAKNLGSWNFKINFFCESFIDRANQFNSLFVLWEMPSKARAKKRFP